MRTSVAVRGTSVDSNDSTEGIRLTKTGRLSKAKKGQPVHKCEQCEKIYTRAEHLRRHMLNHSEETLRCEFEGCTKSFRRVDLLTRHMDEHKAGNLPAIRNATSPSRQSASSARSRAASATHYHHRPDAKKMQEVTSAAAAASGLGIASIYGPAAHYPSPVLSGTSSPPSAPYWTNAFTSAPSVDAGSNVVGGFTLPEPCDPYPFSSPPPYPTPSLYDGDEWLPKQQHHQMMSGSRSPASVASSNYNLSSNSAAAYWQNSDLYSRHRTAFSPSGSSDYSGYQSEMASSIPEGPFGTLGFGVDPAIEGSLYEDMSPFTGHDIFEQDILQRELNSPGCLQFDLEPYICQFLDSYWTNFDPIFPIIHRSTFDTQPSPPLLRHLVIAVGAQFLHDDVAQNVARVLRDCCFKLLDERTKQINGLARLWDLQSVFLAEALSIFKSRRPNPRLSLRFDQLVQGLSNDKQDVLMAELTANLGSLSLHVDASAVHQAQLRWVTTESKRRLLLACYVLELQQTTLFHSERQPVEKDLPLPCTSELWEARTLTEWFDLAKAEPLDPHHFFDYLCLAQRRQSMPRSDDFRASVAVTYFTHSREAATHSHASDFLSMLDRHPRVAFAYHASRMAVFAPVHNLLAVSGDSFVLGEKLATRDQYVEARGALARWVASDAAGPARHHAAQVVSYVAQNGSPKLLQEQWALCLAALVFWASDMWSPEQAESPGGAAEGAAPTRVEDDRAIFAIVQGLLAGPRSWVAASALLSWIRARVAGSMGGLVEDVSNVLRKLVAARQPSA